MPNHSQKDAQPLLALFLTGFVSVCVGGFGMNLMLPNSGPATADRQRSDSADSESRPPDNSVPAPPAISSADDPSAKAASVASTAQPSTGSRANSTEQPVFTSEPSPRSTPAAFPGVQWNAADEENGLRHLPGSLSSYGETFEFPGTISHWAYDARRGRLAVIIPETGLLFYDIERLTSGMLNAAAHVPLADGVDVVFHEYHDRGYFVTATKDSPELIVLDSESLTETSRIDLSSVSSGLWMLRASGNPEDPFIYFLNGNGNQPEHFRFARAICRVSLETGSFESALPSSISAGEIFQVAHDGATLMVRAGAYSNPVLLNVEWGTTTQSGQSIGVNLLRSTVVQNVQAGLTISEIPGRRTVYLNQTEFTTAMLRPCRRMKFDFDVMTFCSNPDIAAGLNRKHELCLADTTSGITYQQITLPDTVQRARLSTRTGSNQYDRMSGMTADESRKLLIVPHAKHLMIVLLNHRDTPQKPQLFLESRPTVRCRVGDPVRIPLRCIRSDTGEAIAAQAEPTAESEPPIPTNPGGENASPIVLATSADADPIGQAAVRDDAVIWTPTDQQLGAQLVKFTVKGSDGLSADLTLDFLVESASGIDLPFYAQKLFLSQDGRHALLWGTDAPTDLFRGLNPISVRDALSRPDRPEAVLAVLDTAERKILCRKQWPPGVGTAAIGLDTVYICDYPEKTGPRIQDLSYRIVELDLQSLTEIASVTEQQFPRSMTVIADRALVFADGQQFSLHGLRRLSESASETGAVGDGYLYQGILWNEDLSEPRLLANPDAFCGLQVLGDPRSPPSFRFDDGSGIRRMSSGHATSVFYSAPQRGRVIVSTPESDSVSHLRDDFGSFEISTRNSIQLTLKQNETELHTKTLDMATPYRPPVGTNRSPGPINRGLVANAAGIVVAAVDRKLYIESTKDFRSESPRLQIAERQTSFVLAADRPTPLTYHCPGATQFELELGSMTGGERQPLLTETSADGSFSIKPEISDQLVILARSIAAESGSRDATVAVPALIQKTGGLFRQLTGRYPTGVCVPLYVIVKASSETQQTALLHWILLEIPSDQIESRLLSTHR
ncbi:MAG: hypothetical protein R3C49_11120 [Planctomycetaceae bacterium]